MGVDPIHGPRILFSTHMDAIGMMVTTLVDGFLHVTEIGGIDPRILPGQLVTVHGRRDLPAMVIQPPDRLLPPEEQALPVKMEHLLVDTGLLPEEVAKLVRRATWSLLPAVRLSWKAGRWPGTRWITGLRWPP